MSSTSQPTPHPRATSAPPSPEKRPTATTSSHPPKKTARSQAHTRVIHSEDETEDDFELDNSNDDEKRTAGSVDEGEEDPLDRYLRMKEDIQRERLVSVIWAFFELYSLLTFTVQPPRTRWHRGQDPRTADLRAMYTDGEVIDKATGVVDKGHFCQACM